MASECRVPQVVPIKYHLRHVVRLLQVVPNKYHLRHVVSMPQVVPNTYHLRHVGKCFKWYKSSIT